MKTVKFKTNINCESCIRSVTPFLNELDNLEMWKVDTNNPDKVLEVTIDDDDVVAVEQVVRNAGFSITLI